MEQDAAMPTPADEAGDTSSDQTKPTQGDMVYENGILFLRDALISREFTDAIKAGDSGRVVLVLKMWALSFRGNGRTKYAHEMLHLIHNLEKVWDEKTRKVVLNNWLLNPTGNAESWVEIDLVQEHLNFWIKAWYKAHGVNTSWDWLAMIGPCVDVLRQLARRFNHDLGSDQGTKHAPPDLSKDISSLMASLNEHKVYEIQHGRILDDDDAPVQDVIQVGLHNLTAGTKNPLSEYNNGFRRLQVRRRTKTVSQMTKEHTSAPSTEPTTAAAATPMTPNFEPIRIHNSGTSPTQVSEDVVHNGSDVEEMDVEETVGDIWDWQGMDEMMIDAPLAPLLTEADVAFDMDLVLVDDIEDDMSDDSDSDSEGGSDVGDA